MPRYAIDAVATTFCALVALCSAHVPNLTGPGCFTVAQPVFGWPRATVWMSCPRCRYNIDHGGSNEVELSSVTDIEALIIAAESGFDVMYSSNIPYSSNISARGSTTNKLWYGYNLKGTAYPFTADEKYDNASIECYQEEQQDGGLWIRVDPKRDEFIFLPTRVRDGLIHTVKYNMGDCLVNLVSAKTDEQMDALLNGMAKDQRTNVLVELVKAALLSSIVFLPELSVAAPMLGRAITACGTLCETASGYMRKALKDPEELKGVMAGLSQQCADNAAAQTSSAEKEAQFATDSAKYFLQQWEDHVEMRKATLQSATNQWLYLLQEVYSTASSSRSNCTVDGAAGVMHAFMKNAQSVNDFYARTGTRHDRPPVNWGEFEGICKVDGDWYYAKWEYSYSSGQDCHETIRDKDEQIEPEYLEMAMNAAPSGANPCRDDSFLCRAPLEGGSSRRLFFI